MVGNTLKNLVLVSVAAAHGAGYASMAGPVPTQLGFNPLSPQASATALPPLNTKVVAQVGESMITGARTYTRPAIRLAQAVIHHGTTTGPFIIQIPAGILIASGASSGPVPGVFFQAQQQLQFSSAGTLAVKGGVFLPDRGGLTPEIYWHAPDTGIPLVDPDSSIQFERTTHEDWQTDSFRRELIYNGRAGSTITLLYRELGEEQIGHAVSQELSYHLEQVLAEGETIAVKGARFRVLAADNVSVKFVVLHHFDAGPAWPNSPPSSPAGPTSDPAGAPVPKSPDGWYGAAMLEADGTIVLQLRSVQADGSIAEGMSRYPKTHPEYQKILDHTGKLMVGVWKPVSPWPEP